LKKRKIENWISPLKNFSIFLEFGSTWSSSIVTKPELKFSWRTADLKPRNTKKCRKHKNTSFSSALMLCTVRVCRVSQLASLLFYFFSFSSSVLESKFKGSAMRIKNLCQEDLAKAFLALTNNKKFRSFYQKHLFQIQSVTTKTKSQKSQK